MSIIADKLNALKQNEIDLRLAYSIMKQLGVNNKYLSDKITANPSGYTFSKFENVSDDWNNQANGLAQFIYDCWKNKKDIQA